MMKARTMAASSSTPSLLVPPLITRHKRPLYSVVEFKCSPRLIGHRGFQASATTVATKLDTRGQENGVLDQILLSCPICYVPLIRKGPPGLNLRAVYRSGFRCQKCNKSFTSKDRYLDLTVTSGTTEYIEFKPDRTELFRSPLVSFLYERGWRQNFSRSGFPGPDEELKMAQGYFSSVFGGVLVDVSCGSGLFSRKFAALGTYSAVIALDFSENMLRQCYELIRQDASLLATNLALMRADVSRLPFASGSIDAVHAGAALHCWPSPSNAVCSQLVVHVKLLVFLRTLNKAVHLFPDQETK